MLNVSDKVEAVRVGDKIDFDKRTLRVETDGSLDPLDAVNQAVTILQDNFQVLNNLAYAEETA